MSEITVILTAFRRPHALGPQFEAVTEQTVSPASVWLWANAPCGRMQNEMARLAIDRVINCSDNAGVHARFALALTAPTEYVAVFDDDTIPGKRWFENCLETMQRQSGILGSAGVVLQDRGYAQRTVHGWHAPNNEVAEVDLVGHAWFLRTEWVQYLFSEPSVTGTNGEDIELSARAWRVAGIRTFCPPHPPSDQDRWGSLQGVTLGSDETAASRRPGHVAERDAIVIREIDRGWQPLYLRSASRRSDAVTGRTGPLPGASGNSAVEQSVGSGRRRTPAEAADGSSADSLIEHALVTSLPAAASRVLVVGIGVQTLAQALRAESRLDVTEVELSDAQYSTGGGNGQAHGQAHLLDTQAIEDVLPPGPFDYVICNDVLARLREPAVILCRAHQLLASDGVLLVTARNLRHHATITALLYGTWAYRSDGLAPNDAVRFFTRRELEKLLYRSGFAVQEAKLLGDGDLAAWRAKGRPGEVKMEQLHIGGLSEQEAEELYAESFAISALRRDVADFSLTSIVLIAHNQLSYTRGCLESIRFYTDEPFELIVVDNGSTDGTVEYLRACRDVHLIENADNRGFPAAANQGIKAANGDQILLLNNDTLVTTGWLERMLCALQSDAKVGLVGPCSNYVSGQQQVAVSYENLADLDGFAWEWGKTHRRVTIAVDRLVGFCLLLRKELVDTIGLLDERFGIGNFEDDDYCVRARQAGFRVVIAKDAFVHHFGHRTFAAAGVDFNAVLRENANRFHAKWSAPGKEAGQETAVAVPSAKDRKPTFTMKAADEGGLLLVRETVALSLCMIVRDNEHTIRPCLESIRPWVDEMIVVDTGSKDATPTICRKLGARVQEFTWCDDFAAARNESLKYATGTWVFWMDSDDTISEENGRKLRELALQAHDPRVLGYVMQVHCPGPGSDGQLDVTVVDHVKLFRNRPDLRFEGRIHEQVLNAIRAAGSDVGWTDLFVEHSGADHTEEGKKRKWARDLRILRLDLAERPDHPFVLFNLGMTHGDARDYHAAIEALTRCLEVSAPTESHVRKAYALLVNSYFQLAQYDAAWRACQQGRSLYADDPELLFREGMLHHQLGRLDDAVAAYQQVLASRDGSGRYFTSIDRGIVGYKARQNMAAVYVDLGRLDLAEEQWRYVVEEVPGYRAGWRGLCETLARQDKLDEAADVAKCLLQDERLRCEGLLARAQVARRRGDLVDAKRDLALAAENSPADDAEPLNRLCQFLFEFGQPEEAQKALRELCERCPHDPAARQNLATVYLRLGQHGKAVAEYEQALRLRPDYPITHLHLGYAYQGLGRDREATTQWNKALRLDPTLSAARQALESVLLSVT